MGRPRVEIEREKTEEQRRLAESIGESFANEGKFPKALVRTFGCQQNEADSEMLRGYLELMGYAFTEDETEADLILINTCAVRKNAELRVFGHLGALTHAKKANPDMMIVLCGCMARQKHVAEKVKKSYRHVNLIFGPQELWRFPELYLKAKERPKKIVCSLDGVDAVAEELPRARDGGVKAFLPIMYGCNNFCTYCVVPYLRGPERSRRPDIIIREAKKLLGEGVKDITLLGQNVNSYGRGLSEDKNFADLLRDIDKLPGDFWLRFMTSHPKDAGEELFRAMAESSNCAKHLHLPVQAGSNRVLKAMNRRYTREEYLEKVKTVKKLIPDLVLTTDVIVGFPGETEDEFSDTLSLIEEVRFDAMFTFIYSPRKNTAAAKMEDPFSAEEKQERFMRLLDIQNQISKEKHEEYIGKDTKVLVDGVEEDGETLSSRTSGGRLVHLKGDKNAVGHFRTAHIERASTWTLFGSLID